MKYDIKCDCCGRFISFDEFTISKGVALFIPDSDVSFEEMYHRCGKCVEKHGKPQSIQQFTPIQ